MFDEALDKTGPTPIYSEDGTVLMGTEIRGSLNRWLGLMAETGLKLSSRNIVATSNSAMWLHGCHNVPCTAKLWYSKNSSH